MASVMTKLHAIDRCKLKNQTFLLHPIDSAQPKCCLSRVSPRLSQQIFMRSGIDAETNLLYVRPPVRMYQGGFHWRYFHVILYWRLAFNI